MIGKILVVDDDYLIRKWLCLLLQKSEKCQAEILQAENGRKALGVIREQAVDLVITDIKMPVLDGIGLIQQLCALEKRPQIAVLSSYDDYNYVRATLKARVLDYLLKEELELKDIDALLELAEQEITQEAVSSRGRKKRDYSVVSEAFSAFMTQDERSFREFQAEFFPEGASYPIDCLVFCLAPNQKTQIFTDELLKLLETVLDRQAGLPNLLIPFPPNLFFFLYRNSDGEDPEEAGRGLLRRFQEDIEQASEYQIASAGFCRLSQESDIRKILRDQADLIVREGFYGQVKSVLPVQKEIQFLSEWKNRIQFEIQKKKISTANELFEEMIQQCNLYAITPKLLINSCIDICYQLSNYIQVTVSSDHLLLVEEAVLRFQQAKTAERVAEIAGEFTALIEDILQKGRRYSPTIEKSLIYITQNYTNKLSLENVSSRVYLNKNYFSELFKKETGLSFNDYINQLRIQKACDLLISKQYTISQVALMTGFSDQNYFSKIFKKIVGKSPKSYQKDI